MVLQKGMVVVGKLCFGSYAKIVQKSIKEPNGQKRVAELLLGLITDNEDVTNQEGEPFVVTDKLASDLFNCKINMRKKIKEASSSQLIVNSAHDYFEDVVMPEIMPEMIQDMIAELVDLISSDDSVPQDKKDEFLKFANTTSIHVFLSDLFLYVIKKDNKISKKSPASLNSKMPSILSDVKKLKELIEKIPPRQPEPITPPEEIENHEMVYVRELLAAYADAEGIDELPKESLESFPKYEKDFKRRRKDYYAAESIRRGARDVFGETNPDHFEILKEETYDGVIDVYENEYPHGLARLKGVMSQATLIRVDKCVYSQIPNWIGASEKKGVCHILVNDGKLRGWVETDE